MYTLKLNSIFQKKNSIVINWTHYNDYMLTALLFLLWLVSYCNMRKCLCIRQSSCYIYYKRWWQMPFSNCSVIPLLSIALSHIFFSSLSERDESIVFNTLQTPCRCTTLQRNRMDNNGPGYPLNLHMKQENAVERKPPKLLSLYNDSNTLSMLCREVRIMCNAYTCWSIPLRCVRPKMVFFQKINFRTQK